MLVCGLSPKLGSSVLKSEVHRAQGPPRAALTSSVLLFERGQFAGLALSLLSQTDIEGGQRKSFQPSQPV